MGKGRNVPFKGGFILLILPDISETFISVGESDPARGFMNLWKLAQELDSPQTLHCEKPLKRVSVDH